MQRVTYNKLRAWVNIWNGNHPEKQFKVQGYNGYYHIFYYNGNKLCSAKTPGQVWELFTMWKYGYLEGKANS
jgi:hypothetical protein